MAEPLQAGLTIGGYQLVRRIGRGGMAEVWVARRHRERRASKYVAIKVVADPYVGDPRYQRMFRIEAELSALLNHANIVQVFDEGEDQGRGFLVMEWVDGANLLKVEAALTFVDDDEVRNEIISYIIGQLLYALKYAHSITLHDGNPLGIVHRDVSPQNVLVSAQGEVKLTDFGVAHHVLEESSGVHVKGKLRYMSPEQVAGRTRDPRVDLYAVGAILHEMLDGRRFRSHVEDQRQMYLEVLSGTIPTLSRPAPVELDELRRRLLEPQPAQRLASADAALDLLERFPGHGDARRELTTLCSALTGVMRPRVGPERSGALAGTLAPRPTVDPPPPTVAPPEDDLPAATEPFVRRATVPMGPGIPAPLEPVPSSPPTTPAAVRDPMGVAPSWPPAPLDPSMGSVSATERLDFPAGPGPDLQDGPAEVTLTSAASTRPAGPGPVEPPPRRSGSALVLVLGSIGLLAGMGGAGWLLYHQGQQDARAPERSEAAIASPATTVPNEREDANAEAEPVEAHELPPLASGSSGSSSSSDDGDAAASEPPDATDSGTSGEHGDTSEEPDGGTAGSVEPGLETAEAARRRPRSGLSAASDPALGVIEVLIRSTEPGLRKKIRVSGKADVGRLPVGRYRASSRRAGQSTWSEATRFELRRGCDLRLIIKSTGMSAVAMGSCG
ncbi:MAG: protein kinase [Myxococcales bacterium]|nr:protein kinase [Myxococcales bacterium]